MPAPKNLPPAWGYLTLVAALGCDDTAVVGRWECAQSPPGDVSVEEALPTPSPWSTGFERGFCDYAPADGFCYVTDAASYELVTEPVRTGHYAAAFTVNTDPEALGTQARCVRQGILPESATYGAWYYFPEMNASSANWNLFHFQGGATPSELLRGLWDLSIGLDADGGMRLVVRDGLSGTYHETTGIPPLPVNRWVHLEFSLRRAAEPTGMVEVRQDGELGLRLSDIVTDDTAWGQWYLGNLADELEPTSSTVYVDDVTLERLP